MNIFESLLDQPLTHRLGWTLVHSLWQGTVIAASFALFRSVLQRHSANSRYLAGCISLLLLVGLQFVTFFTLPERSLPFATSGFSSGGNNFGTLTLTPVLAKRGLGLAIPHGSADQFLAAFQLIVPWLTVAWFIGVFACSVKLLHGFHEIRRLRSDATGLLDPSWLEILNDLRCRLNITRPVSLLKSCLVEVPTVIGWLRPVVLLPASTVTGLTSAQLEAILAHELAHVLRYDYFVNTFQLVGETLMFYHPAVWWISRCIREERELCCDDLVLQVCSDRVVYARALAKLEELRSPSPRFAFAASGGPLLERIRRLIGSPAVDRPVSVREICGFALLVIGLLLITTGVFLLVAAPKYQGVARVKIEREPPAQRSHNDMSLAAGSYDPYLIQTEFEVLQSDEILNRVVEELRLNEKWREGRELAKGEAVALLRAGLKLRPVRGTSLIEIRCVSKDPGEAAAIANAIVTAYCAHRQESRTQANLGTIKALEEQFKIQEKDVQEAASKVSQLRDQLQISDAEANGDGPILTWSAETLRKLESHRIETHAEVVQQEALLTELKKLNPDDLIQALPSAVPNPLLNTLAEQLNITEQALVIKKKEVGPNHTDVIKLLAQLEDLKDKIQKAVKGIMFALEARVSAQKKSLESLEGDVGSITKIDAEKVQKTRPYYDAKRRLTDLQRFAQLLSMKIASEKIDIDLPRSTLIQIIDKAIAPNRPFAPNRYLGFCYSSLGVLLAVSGLLTLRGIRGPVAIQIKE